jgi:hypothetical protein
MARENRALVSTGEFESVTGGGGDGDEFCGGLQ